MKIFISSKDYDTLYKFLSENKANEEVLKAFENITKPLEVKY